MMMDSMSGGGQNGAMQAQFQKLMQRKMMEDFFGLKADEAPIHAAAAVAGTDPNGSFGVLGVRLYSATLTSMKPRLELETNGKLSVRPDEIHALVKFLQGAAEEIEAKYDEALEAAKNLEGAEMMGTMMGIKQE